MSEYEPDDVQPELSDAEKAAREAYLAAFTRDYAHAMLWANTDELAMPDSCQATRPGQAEEHDLATCSHNGPQPTGNAVYPEDWQTPEDGWQLRAFAPASRLVIEADCRDFVAANWADLKGLDPGDCGHDFALTRNGHGTGFWDRGYGDQGHRLAEASKPYGESSAWFDTADPEFVHLDAEPAPEAPDPHAGHGHHGDSRSLTMNADGHTVTSLPPQYRDREAGH